VCVDAITGELKWTKDLVKEFGTAVPPWYAGQCPLVEDGVVVLGVGGADVLLAGLDLETGDLKWQTPNPQGWKMTHASVMRAQAAGETMYVYCGHNGVAAVSRDGKPLWATPDWKISIATVPSPLPLDDGKIFFSGGYNAGSVMMEVKKTADGLSPATVFRLPAEVFGATQHTPILYQGHIYGVRADGKFVCLSLDGKVVWASPSGQQFGLGGFILVNDVFLAMNDNGLLRMLAANPVQYELLGQAQVLKGRESWAPLAVADGRLIARDLTRLICLDLTGK
jgi:outer membrane protein assembly factor BamB